MAAWHNQAFATDRLVFDAVFLGPRYQDGQQVNVVAEDLLQTQVLPAGAVRSAQA